MSLFSDLGEQVHILACLSACKEDAEIITPFKVAAMMSKNGFGKSPEKQNGSMEDCKGETRPGGRDANENAEKLSSGKIGTKKNVSDGESLFRMEDHKRQTELLLQRFEKAHYFVRIAESDEPLWSKKSASSQSSGSSEMDGQSSADSESQKSAKAASRLNAVIDKGNFDPAVSGGAARNTVRCCSLSNGDIVVRVIKLVGT